jgi:hypothetical protein
MLGMTAAQPFGQENFYKIPDQLALAVAEEPFHCRIRRRDTAIDSGYDNRVWGGEKKLFEQRLRMVRDSFAIHVRSHEMPTFHRVLEAADHCLEHFRMGARDSPRGRTHSD